MTKIRDDGSFASCSSNVDPGDDSSVGEYDADDICNHDVCHVTGMTFRYPQNQNCIKIHSLKHFVFFTHRVALRTLLICD